MGIKRNHWAARVSLLALLLAILTVPQTPSSQAANRCQTLETIALSSYSGTVGGAQIALTNYKNCLVQQYGSTKASLVPCARYHQIASAFVVLSSSSQYLTKALVDYTWCVTGEKSIYESKVLTSCDSYLDVVRIALAAGDVALASFARDASSDCRTRTLISAPTPTPTPTPSKSPTPSPTPTPTVLLEMPLPPLPSFSGEVQIGKTVTLVWSSPISGYDSVTYQWRQICTSNTNCRGSLEIPGATQGAYTIQSKDAGYGISVNILFKKAGYKNYERFLQVSSSVPKPVVTPTPTPTKPVVTPTPTPTKPVVTPTPTPTSKPTSGVITQPSLAPTPNSGVDCTSNPTPLCGGSVAPPLPSTIPAPIPMATSSTIPAPTPIAAPAPATSLVEVLCFETYPASNNPKTLVTATIATRIVESRADSQSCPIGMTRTINKKPVFAEAGIFRSSDKTQINYSPTKDNSSGAGNRLERFFACNTQISMSPKRSDIPKTTTTISRTLGDDEVSCPQGSTFVATVFYHGYKTIKGQAYGGLGGQWPDWTYSSQPTKQKTSVAGKCAFDGQVGFWESSAKHVLVCRPDAKSGRLTWTQ
jgi:hypothetical protein